MLYEENRQGIMRKKKEKKLIQGKNPMNAMYEALSPRQRAEFKRFAGAFGYSEEMIRNILKDERDGRCDN